MQPKISIIVPVYNAERFIGKCLNSILNQSYRNYELILVDNDSKDDSKEIIKKFQKEDKRIKYFFEKIHGGGASRCTGQKNAKGKIILMTDFDCIVPKDWIKKMTSPLEKKECDAVMGGEESATESFWDKMAAKKAQEKIKKYNKGRILGVLDTKNLAINKITLKKIGFNNPKYEMADLFLAINFQKANLKLKILEDIKVKHHNPQTISQVIKRHIERGKIFSVIARDNYNLFKKENFLQEGAYTIKSFFKINELIKTIKKEGIGFAYFEFVCGFFWRVGIITKKIGLIK